MNEPPFRRTLTPMSDKAPSSTQVPDKGRFFELRCGVCGSVSRLFPGEIRLESFKAFDERHSKCLDTKTWFAVQVSAIRGDGSKGG
jgi:hypothetical protein